MIPIIPTLHLVLGGFFVVIRCAPPCTGPDYRLSPEANGHSFRFRMPFLEIRCFQWSNTTIGLRQQSPKQCKRTKLSPRLKLGKLLWQHLRRAVVQKLALSTFGAGVRPAVTSSHLPRQTAHRSPETRTRADKRNTFPGLEPGSVSTRFHFSQRPLIRCWR